MMAKITIEVKKYEKLTKRKFLMRYLFQKSLNEGGRMGGESDVSEMYSGWVEACSQIVKPPGKSKKLTEELWRMTNEGIVQVTRTAESSGVLPKNFYVLTEEYFEFMKNGGGE